MSKIQGRNEGDTVDMKMKNQTEKNICGQFSFGDICSYILSQYKSYRKNVKNRNIKAL